MFLSIGGIMKIAAALFILNFVSTFVFAAIPQSNEKQLENFCKNKNGTLTKIWTCPLSGKVRDGLFCELKDKSNNLQITNGCTGAYGLGQEFFKACVLHDFCYHNHGVLDGKTKAGCDDKFLNNMYSLCDQEADQSKNFSRNNCYVLAQQVFYKGVKYFGEDSWKCSNTNTEYPQSIEEIPSQGYMTSFARE